MNVGPFAAMCRLLAFVFLPLLLILAAGPGAAASPPVSGPVLQCPSARSPIGCRPFDLDQVSAFPRNIVLARKVQVPPRSASSSGPLMVWLVATASAELRWNGIVIGRNGLPGQDAAHERPGRFIASVEVPPELVRPGANFVTARMSSHHLWLPVRRTIHQFEVLPYQPIILPGLFHYLPALIMLGGLAATFLFFAAARLLDRADRGALFLAGIAGVALVQLGIETARSFILYPYPWHLARVGAVALLAAANGVLIAAYAARRFMPEWEGRVAGIAAAAGVASVVLIPWFDVKALAALAAAFLLVAACALAGWRRGPAQGALGTFAALLFFVLLAWQRTEMLDRAYYILLTVILVALAAEQLAVLRDARRGRQAETTRADALEAALAKLGRAPSGTALLKDGSRTHHIPEEEIVFARAADDYAELVLRDGRTLLVTMNLARLVDALSDRFVRVHKSYMVNAAAVAAVGPRPGGGRQILLSDGSKVPLGRSYGDALGSLAAG